jgi:hypothetical protein
VTIMRGSRVPHLPGVKPGWFWQSPHTYDGRWMRVAAVREGITSHMLRRRDVFAWLHLAFDLVTRNIVTAEKNPGRSPG